VESVTLTSIEYFPGVNLDFGIPERTPEGLNIKPFGRVWVDFHVKGALPPVTAIEKL
jgi:hypothetical protein